MKHRFLDKTEVLISKILFEDKLRSSDFFQMDINKLVVLSSKHLILPLIYSLINKKKIRNNFPIEFLNYAEEIYLINKNRNEQLLNEINEISKTFKKNNVNHVFIKGSALIVSDLYNSIGERMVGDIDVLVCEKTLKKSYDILKKNGYEEVKKNEFFQDISKHLPRVKHKKKLFAVELHRRITRKKKITNTS